MIEKKTQTFPTAVARGKNGLDTVEREEEKAINRDEKVSKEASVAHFGALMSRSGIIICSNYAKPLEDKKRRGLGKGTLHPCSVLLRAYRSLLCCVPFPLCLSPPKHS